MSIQIGSGGKVLLGPGSKVATNPACCCGGTNCPRTISFEVNIDQSEIDAGGFSGSFVTLWDSGDDLGIIEFFANYDTGTWAVFSDVSSLDVEVISPIVADTWNTVSLSLSSPCDIHAGCSAAATLTVNGDSATQNGKDEGGASGQGDQVRVGAMYGSGNNFHSVRNVSFISEVPDWSFNYPGDTFDSNTGGITFVGADTVRVDGSGDQYAEADMGDQFTTCCDCADSIAVTFNDIAVSCGCVQRTVAGDGTIEVTDNGINGTFTLTSRTPNPSRCFWFYSNTNADHEKFYSGATDCSGTPTETDMSPSIEVIVDSDCVWHVYYQSGYNVFFYATSSSLPVGVANSITGCGVVTPSYETSSGNAVATGGLVTITIP